MSWTMAALTSTIRRRSSSSTIALRDCRKALSNSAGQPRSDDMRPTVRHASPRHIAHNG
jgi:hypothetical protein